MAEKFKKGDPVLICKGAYRGHRGVILQIVVSAADKKQTQKRRRALVQGEGLQRRRGPRRGQANTAQNPIIDGQTFVDISNLAHPGSDGKPDRAAFRYTSQKGKERYLKRTKEVLNVQEAV